MLDNVDVILTGHTHDAIPRAIKIKNTLLLSSGSHGKYLGRIDLKVDNGKVVDFSSNLIPIFSDIIQPDPEMTRLINEIREPYEEECNRVVGQARLYFTEEVILVDLGIVSFVTLLFRKEMFKFLKPWFQMGNNFIAWPKNNY